jgi:TolB-like protein/DNA-binding winged helix-turn-helix (wHTH) protein/tetratricopeptide (TPR) repeat protein
MGMGLEPLVRREAAGEGEAAALRFGAFELDLRTLEMRRAGVLVRLQQQPARVLALLAGRSGRLITREEIQREVWGDSTFVDFDQGLNFCVRQIRGALGDQADTPRYVETLPRRGYRFLAPVERIEGRPAPDAASVGVARLPRPRFSSRGTRRLRTAAAVSLALLLAVGAAWFLRARRASTAVTGARVMLVVLPFENLSPEADQEYFSDGLTEEMITQLARLHPDRLGVIARTSANVYRKTGRPVDQIGRELGVDYVLEGSVRKAGARLKVTAQLIRVKDQTHLWAESYERPVADALLIQDDVARRIVSALETRLLTPPPPLPARPPGFVPAAYDAYLKGRYELQKRRAPGAGPEGPQQSLAPFEKAIALDPGFSLAHAGLASAHLALVDESVVTTEEGFPRAKASAERALALEEASAEAHAVLAVVNMYYDWDWPGARAHFERALAVDPGRAATWHLWAGFLSAQGRHGEAIAAMERARTLDPLSAAVNGDVGWYYYMARHHDEAIRQFKKALELEPGILWVRAFLVDAYAAAGRPEDARAQILELMKARGATPERIAVTERLEPAEAIREMRRRAAAGQMRETHPAADFVALRLAQLGEKEEAFRWLEKACAVRARWLVQLLASDPGFDGIRSDPRFAAYLQRVGLTSASAQRP